MPLYVAGTGASLELGQLLGRGGEGSVYELRHSPQHAIKIYQKPLDPLRIEKLTVMPKLANAELLSLAAWPEHIVLNERGSVAGFIMPRIAAAKDIHELYSPKSRIAMFPKADFRFVVHVAANVARAFAIIHKFNHVIGDVNHGSILICGNGTVKLIDCDSFQIKDGHRTLPCVVGSPLFAPPEMQSKSFATTPRTEAHDRFGLAVVLFQLLFMGRHPFAGRYTGSGDMPIERAIAERRFPYGPNATSVQMVRPPGTLPLDMMGPTVESLFLNAFGNDVRPSATDWVDGLQKLQQELRTCTYSPSHQFPKHAHACPWCKFEEDGVQVFGIRNPLSGVFQPIDPSQLWSEINAIPDPGPAPKLEYELLGPKARPERRIIVLFHSFRGWLGFVTSLFAMVVVHMLGATGIVYLLGIVSSISLGFLLGADWRKVNHALEQRRATAKSSWEVLVGQWNAANNVRFLHKKNQLKQLMQQLQSLPNERNVKLQAVIDSHRDIQLSAYLSRFRIDKAKIPNIGASRTATLASYGIETAADITQSRVMAISGFGYHVFSSLSAWRSSHAANFRYVPNNRPDPNDVSRIDQELTVKQRRLLAELKEGANELRAIAEEVVLNRSRLKTQLTAAWSQWELAMQAKA